VVLGRATVRDTPPLDVPAHYPPAACLHRGRQQVELRAELFILCREQAYERYIGARQHGGRISPHHVHGVRRLTGIRSSAWRRSRHERAHHVDSIDGTWRGQNTLGCRRIGKIEHEVARVRTRLRQVRIDARTFV
jgi:hypothetical protein